MCVAESWPWGCWSSAPSTNGLVCYVSNWSHPLIFLMFLLMFANFLENAGQVFFFCRQRLYPVSKMSRLKKTLLVSTCLTQVNAWMKLACSWHSYRSKWLTKIRFWFSSEVADLCALMKKLCDCFPVLMCLLPVFWILVNYLQMTRSLTSVAQLCSAMFLIIVLRFFWHWMETRASKVERIKRPS